MPNIWGVIVNYSDGTIQEIEYENDNISFNEFIDLLDADRQSKVIGIETDSLEYVKINKFGKTEIFVLLADDYVDGRFNYKNIQYLFKGGGMLAIPINNDITKTYSYLINNLAYKKNSQFNIVSTFRFWTYEPITSATFTKSFDTSTVTQLFECFYKSNNITKLNGLYNWNTSKVTNMASMFSGCSQLTTLNLSNWDTSNVEDMNDMFINCTSLEIITGISNWNTSKVTDMNSMFSYCTSLKELDLSNWDVSNATDMNDMFYNCIDLTKLILGPKFPFSKIESMITALPGTWTLQSGYTYTRTDI